VLLALLIASLVLTSREVLADEGASSPQPVAVAGHSWALTGVDLGQPALVEIMGELLDYLGVAQFREPVKWSDVQPGGPDDWDWSRLDALFEIYRAKGWQALMLVNSGSAEWATDVSGLSAEHELTADCPPLVLPGLDEPILGSEPYFLFVRQLVIRYGDAVSAWLIDNEPSEPWSWAGDSYSYACMARLAAAAIHDADPAAVAVLGALPAGTAGAMAIADRLDDPSEEAFIVSFASRLWGYEPTIDQIRAILTSPESRTRERVDFFREALLALPHMDALAANVLGRRARGYLAGDVVWAYADQMTSHGGGERPLVYTEVNPYLSDELALARETTQLMIGSLASGKVSLQAYHQFVDDSVERVPEPDSGLVTRTLQPKIGYHAYRTLTSVLQDAVIAGELSLSHLTYPRKSYRPVTGYWFETDSKVRVYALWAPETAHVDLSDFSSSDTGTLVDMTGGMSTIGLDRVPVGPSPVYVVVVPYGMHDVPWDHWAFDHILACAEAGIVTCYPDGSYRPAAVVTRDQMAVFIARALAGGDSQVPQGPLHPSFKDVSVGHWAFNHVEFTNAQNVVAGYPDGLYRPEGPVDRAQMAVYIARSLMGEQSAVPDGPAKPTFEDVSPLGEWSWCYDHVEYLNELGMVLGHADGLYHPEDLCSRDQIAVYLARGFGLTGD
jgi:hypothetical protein